MLRDENSFFAQLFNSTQSFVALYQPQGHTFIQVNHFGIKMFEMQDTGEFVMYFMGGKIWLNPPEDVQAYLNEIELEVNSRGQLEKEMQFLTASGKPFWGLLRIDALNINNVNYFLIKITDIDVFKTAELRAVRNVQQFLALFNNSTIGILITNQQGQIINFNEHAEKQFGYSKEEILGQSVEVLLPANFEHNHKTYRDEFLQHPQNRVMGAGRDLYALRKDHSQFPVEISLSPFRTDDQNYVIAFMIDISVRKRSEAMVLRQKEELEMISTQVKQLNAELEKKVEDRTKMLKEALKELEMSKQELSLALDKERELGELKSRFVTMASHEFRTPLSTILSSAYIAQQYVSSDEQEKRNKHLLKIQQSVQTLTFILEDFLSLEKLEEGAVKVCLAEITNEELVSEVENLIEEMVPLLKKGQSINFAHSNLAHTKTDQKLLKNILVNLVSNAIKYSPESSIINIDAVGDNNKLKIMVTDQGIGIPEQEQKHLFTRFFRATNASTIQGTGLGLHIVTRYLSLIKGDINVKSELNKGTTITILLNSSL